MPRPCSICVHAQREEIDAALVTDTHRAVAKRFGLGESAVYRHKIDHLVSAMARTSKVVPTRAETVTEAAEVIEVARADRLVDRVEALRGRAMRFLDELESLSEPDYKAAASMLREARGCIELQARLLGEMQAGQLANNPIVEGLMRVVLGALADEPAAHEKVVAAVRAEIEARRAGGRKAG